MAPSRIAVLAQEIQTNTAKLDDFFTTSGLPHPSLDEDTPLNYDFPPDIAAAREALAAALDELTVLNRGALETVSNKSWHSSVGFDAIINYGIHNHVPLNDGTTFEDLAEKTGLPLKKLTRILRQAIADRFFLEPRPGLVKHSAATKALVTIPQLSTWCELFVNELVPARSRAVDAVAKWPESEDSNQTGWNLAVGTDKAMFDYYEDNPDRGARFKTAMSFTRHLPGMDYSSFVRDFDWASLGKATVVDLGGSHGQLSLDIARANPDLRVVIQDLPKVIEHNAAPSDLADRVTYMAHDFFTEQPLKDAKVYYFRFILHDWADKYCIKILRALIPALNPGDKVVLSELCLEPPGFLPIHQDKWFRDFDIMMMAASNSLERDEDEWVTLFRAADPRYSLEGVKRSPGCKLATIIFRWD